MDSNILKKIKLLILDVDGIMTDCKIWLDGEGEWRRFFSIRDGVGIKNLLNNGIQVGVITGSKSKDIQLRVKNLGITYFYEGALDKIPSFEDLLLKSGFKETEMAYMGDDLFDIPILKRVAFSATVPEAQSEVLSVVNFITQKKGGEGAVREVCDMIAHAQGFDFKI